jgi:hypothetical protein
VTGRRARQTALAVATILALAACGGDADTTTSDLTTDPTSPTTVQAEAAPTTTTPPPPTEPSSTEAAPVPIPEILRFAAPVVGGGELDAASFAGAPVALWFWAPG